MASQVSQAGGQTSSQSGGQMDSDDFLASINQVCKSVADTVDTEYVHHQFFNYCAREQLKVHDPKARSYGVVAQLVCTSPKMW